jgi:hypothetical protein
VSTPSAPLGSGTPGGVNLDRLPPLPVPGDTANLREGPDLHQLCLPLLPLVGVWRGEGVVVYSTMPEPVHFGQQIEFAHDGRPFLTYNSRAWLLDGPGGKPVRPAARESGFWRAREDDSIEVLITHATGIVEIFYGEQRGTTSWELATDVVMRTETAKEVNTSKRLYGLVDAATDTVGATVGTNGTASAPLTDSPVKDLAYVDERAMVGEPLHPHISAQLRRIAG